MTVIPFPARKPPGLSRAALQLLADIGVRDLGLSRADAEAICFGTPPRGHDWGRQHNEHVCARSAWLLLHELAANGRSFVIVGE